MLNCKCAICEKKLRFIKMKFDGGYVCKECYSIVSRNFSETIVKKNYDDIIKIYNSYKENSADFGEFEITRKIADLILFDDNNKLVCLPNNKRLSPKNLHPEIFNFNDIAKCELRQDNKIIEDVSEVTKEISKDKNKAINTLRINIILKDSKMSCKNINIISSPVRASSFAYQKSIEFAKEIVSELNKIAG